MSEGVRVSDVEGAEDGGRDGADDSAVMQIGVVAERLGLSQRTLHHWEESGLVTPSARSAGGFRLYTEADVERLITIRRMKPLGFAIEEMKDLLHSSELLSDPGASADDVAAAKDVLRSYQQRVEESCAELRKRLAWAEEFRDILKRKVAVGPRSKSTLT
jgi:MerR family transcriptional regulator, copper efflux regulator